MGKINNMRLPYLGAAFVFFVNMSAFAAPNINLNIVLKFQGNTMKPKATIALGQLATLTQRNSDGSEFEITITPAEKEISGKSEKAIDMKFIITEIDHSARKVIARMRVITRIGNQATIAQDTGDQDKVELSVTPEIAL